MKKILLVNSLASSLAGQHSLLNRAGFKAVFAESAEKALQIHRQERVDLIIAELDLPGMGGDLLCAAIRSESNLRGVAVVLICADSPASLERVSRCGANGWLPLSLSAERLVESIGKFLGVSTRMGYRVLLRARVHGSVETSTFFCTSRNISVSGILIETEAVLDRGARITCSFFLPGSRQIVADGDVVRRAQNDDGYHHYGIRFIDLAAESQAEIERFIASAL